MILNVTIPDEARLISLGLARVSSDTYSWRCVLAFVREEFKTEVLTEGRAETAEQAIDIAYGALEAKVADRLAEIERWNAAKPTPVPVDPSLLDIKIDLSNLF